VGYLPDGCLCPSRWRQRMCGRCVANRDLFQNLLKEGSSVSAVTELLEGDDRGSILGRGSYFFLFVITSRPALRPTQPPIQWLQGVKQPGREADDSPRLGPILRTGGAISPLQHVLMVWGLVKHRGNFTCFVLHTKLHRTVSLGGEGKYAPCLNPAL
jgi:hypothetical protein